MKYKIIIAVIAVFWLGMIVAIGMESIVKFQTATLTKPVAFDVGRTVFAAFNKAQLVLLGAMVMMAFCVPTTLMDKSIFTALGVILLLQIVWIFPSLSQRVDLILAGMTPEPTYKHALYGGLELLKIGLLIVLAFLNLSS